MGLLSLRRPAVVLASMVAAFGLMLQGCQKQSSGQVNFQPGETIPTGSLTYNVVQTTWRTELGDILKRRSPQHRFLMITISASNKGRQPVLLPFFALEGDDHQEFAELQDGAGVNNWFGLLRELGPGDTRQGTLVFDVPLRSYRLRLTDGGDPGSERFVWVEIPLNLDTDSDSRMLIPNVGAASQ